METAISNVRTEALKNGLIWGIISIVIFLASWYVSPEFMGSWTYTGLIFVVGLGLSIFFVLDMRKKAGGYWTFNEAIWPIFVTFILSALISYIFTIIFSKFIDTSYPTVMREVIGEKTATILRDLGQSEDQIKQAMAGQNAQLEKQFNPTFSQAIVGFGITAIIYFVFTLIYALIFKKSNPNPFLMDTTED